MHVPSQHPLQVEFLVLLRLFSSVVQCGAAATCATAGFILVVLGFDAFWFVVVSDVVLSSVIGAAGTWGAEEVVPVLVIWGYGGYGLPLFLGVPSGIPCTLFCRYFIHISGCSLQ